MGTCIISTKEQTTRCYSKDCGLNISLDACATSNVTVLCGVEGNLDLSRTVGVLCHYMDSLLDKSRTIVVEV